MRANINTHINQEDTQADVAHASHTETHVEATRGVKRPTEKLAYLIGLVNLVPKDAVLPDSLVDDPLPLESAVLLDAINRLPGELKSYLLELYERGFSKPVASACSELDRWPNATWRNHGSWEIVRNQLVVVHYRNVRNAREGFQRLIRQQNFVDQLVRGGSIISISEEHKIEVSLDFFASAVQGVDVRYLRECPVCGRIFFAGRIFSEESFGAGCSRKCNKRIRQDKWRAKCREGEDRGARLTQREENVHQGKAIKRKKGKGDKHS
jgi:hypothetical protein